MEQNKNIYIQGDKFSVLQKSLQNTLKVLNQIVFAKSVLICFFVKNYRSFFFADLRDFTSI